MLLPFFSNIIWCQWKNVLPLQNKGLLILTFLICCLGIYALFTPLPTTFIYL